VAPLGSQKDGLVKTMPAFLRSILNTSNRGVYTGATVASVERLGVRELRNQVAGALRRAEAGERIVITVDGRPVAQLGPLDPVGSRPSLADLAARGLLSLPHRNDRPPAAATARTWTGTRLDRSFDQIR
jgi:prevent-host-death family protein